MSNRNLITLACVAVIMVVLASIQHHIVKSRVAPPPVSGHLIQGLPPEQIDSIVFDSVDSDETVRLKRQGDGFVIQNISNYPAINREVNRLINTCLDIRKEGLITDDPVNHPDLMVTEETAKSYIRFLDENGKLLVGILLGRQAEERKPKKPGPRTEKAYVRLDGQDEVYIANKKPWLPTSAMSYVSQELIRIPEEDIDEITLAGPDTFFTIEVDPNQVPLLPNLPAGYKINPEEMERTFNMVKGIYFLGIRKLDPTLNFDHAYVVHCKDSRVYTLRMAKDPTDPKTFWITADAEFTDKTPIIKERRIETDEELRKKEAKLIARDTARSFDERHEGWMYRIADWPYESMTRKMSDLLVKVVDSDPNAPAESLQSVPVPDELGELFPSN